MALLMSYGDMSIESAQTLMFFSILHTAFPLAAPLIVITHPGLIKPNRTDSKYMGFCLYAGLFRSFFWALAIVGLRDHMTVLFLNAFGISIYALLESRFKRISNEYFKY